MSDLPPVSSASAPSVAEAAVVLPSFQATPFKPDMGFEPSGLLMLFSAMALGGAVLGFAAHFVAQAFYLIVLFPVLIGAGLGAIGTRMVRAGRTRNPLIAGAAGLLGGIFAMTMMHYFDYESFKSFIGRMDPIALQVARQPAEVREKMIRTDLSDEERKSLALLVEAASVHNFGEYMNLEAHRGVEIKPGHDIGNDRQGGLKLGYVGSFVYWGLEILLVAGITFVAVRKATAEPYCAECREWKKSALLGFFGGDPAQSAVAIHSGDLNIIRSAAKPTKAPTPLHVSLATCESCGTEGPVELKVETVTRNRKGKVEKKTVGQATYPPDARAPIEALFAKAETVTSPAAGIGAGDPKVNAAP